MRLLPASIAIALLAVVPSVALAQNQWEELMGRKPRLWTDPAGRFTIDLPTGWTAKPQDNGLIEIGAVHAESRQRAVVNVEIRNLPPGVKLSHFAVRAGEEVQKVARNYNPIDEDKVEVSGVPARRRYFTYQDKAHAELTSEVVQVMFVAGEKGVVITLETAYGARVLFWEDFNIMVRGFNLTGSAGAAPTADDGKVAPPTDRKQGEGRRKLRSGEMVNPDGVPY